MRITVKLLQLLLHKYYVVSYSLKAASECETIEMRASQSANKQSFWPLVFDPGLLRV